MMKTGAEFEQYICKLVVDSSINDLITGEVYFAGLRPTNSKLEDAVVSFQTGVDGQFQKGNVNVNIYVPNIVFTDKYGVSTNIKNFNRCNLVEKACAEFVKTLKVNKYKLSLATTIQTFEFEEANQHFVNMRIRYIHTTF